MLDRPPNTWLEVPDAVRTALEAPFIKKADGLPGLSQVADVLGWRVSDLNAHYGGPRPLTNLLIGASLGSLGGYGVGRLAESVLPDKYFEPGALRRRGALLGGIGLSLPALYQGYDNVRQSGGDLSSLADPWPVKSSYEKYGFDIFQPQIHRSQFSAAVFGDDFTPPALRAATAGLVTAASSVRGSDLVSPFDVSKIAIGAGAGLVSGLVAGKALGVLAGLTPEAQQGIQRMGLWSGILNQVVPPALGLR